MRNFFKGLFGDMFTPKSPPLKKDLTLVEFCENKLGKYKFKNVGEVILAIRDENLIAQYCFYSKKPVLCFDDAELAQQVFDMLSKEDKQQ